MAARVTAWLLAALLASVLFALPSVRADDGPAQKALEAARQVEARVTEDVNAPPDAYKPVVRLLRDIAQRYPGSPQAAQALSSLGQIYCHRLSRYEDGVAAWEQLIQKYPGTSEAWNALGSLHNVITVLMKRPDRAQQELHRMIEVLRRALPAAPDEASRCWVLKTLALASDLAGDTEQAAAYCQHLLDTAPQDRFFADYARDYVEYAQTWPHLGLTETCSALYITPADSLTSDIEVEQKNRRSLGVSMRAPLGREFAFSVTFSSPAPTDATVPKVETQTSPDGRTLAAWKRTFRVDSPYSGSSSGYVEAVWKSKVHFDGVKVWRTAEIIRPGRQLVTVTVETDRPVAVDIAGSDETPIDPRTIIAPVPPDIVTRRQASWQYEPGKQLPENSTMGSLNCAGGRTFTFEMDLPPGVRCMMPRVTVTWSRMAWPLGPLGPRAPLAESPRTTRYTGTLGEVGYALASETPFRVVDRHLFDYASCLLSERTEREYPA